MLNILDILAFGWIKRRAQVFIRGNVPPAWAHPLALFIANDAAEMITDSNAENGVTLMFHSDRHNRDVVLDVRWADGKTPGERLIAFEMMRQAEAARREREALEAVGGILASAEKRSDNTA